MKRLILASIVLVSVAACFDFAVDDGAGTATASVPFIPLPGDRSVVIHALATDHHTGLAGARLACLPVQW